MRKSDNNYIGLRDKQATATCRKDKTCRIHLGASRLIIRLYIVVLRYRYSESGCH